jgi:signal transduction histidine kinase
MSRSLEQKNTRSFLTWLPLVMLGGSLFFYLLMRGHVLHMQRQQLQLKQDNIWNALQSAPGSIPLHIKGEYDIDRGTSRSANFIGRARDTSLYYAADKEWIPFDLLTRRYNLQGTSYQITTYISSKEIIHLLIKVSLAEALIFFSLLAAIVVINRKSSRRLWRPFYDTMHVIRAYDILQNEPLALAGHTGVEEFDRLNHTLAALIDHVSTAYVNQKQFTENAAHELQTPLAIIRSKVELLIDAAGLTEETARLLAEISDANDRLSQMNKNLLLLTKIDNRQFPEEHAIQLSYILGKLIANYQDHYEDPLPSIQTVIQPGVEVIANSSLMEILLTNLLRNAVVHNIPDGWLHIRLADMELTVENSGLRLEGDTERLFERFKKGREESRTTGLGLALVKQICHYYHFGLEYHHLDGTHRVRVAFSRTGFPNSS